MLGVALFAVLAQVALAAEPKPDPYPSATRQAPSPDPYPTAGTKAKREPQPDAASPSSSSTVYTPQPERSFTPQLTSTPESTPESPADTRRAKAKKTRRVEQVRAAPMPKGASRPTQATAPKGWGYETVAAAAATAKATVVGDKTDKGLLFAALALLALTFASASLLRLVDLQARGTAP